MYKVFLWKFHMTILVSNMRYRRFLALIQANRDKV